jgi:Protein tyrosine and serine/threonine kinase
MKGMTFTQIRGVVGYDESFKMEIPTNCHPLLTKIMKICLEREPEKRPRFKDILEMVQKHKKADLNSEKSKFFFKKS